MTFYVYKLNLIYQKIKSNLSSFIKPHHRRTSCILPVWIVKLLV